MNGLSSTQKPIWFDQCFHGNSSLYNIGGYVHIQGGIDVNLFQRSLHLVLQHADVFRFQFLELEDNVVQKIVPTDAKACGFMDFSSLPSAKSKCLEWLEDNALTPLDLEKQNTFQFSLLKAGETDFYWQIKLHHLLGDGWAISLLIKRVSEAYQCLVEGESWPKKNLPQYQDFLGYDEEYLSSEDYQKDKSYWEEEMANFPGPLGISNLNQKNGLSPKSLRKSLYVSQKIYAEIDEVSKAFGASPFHYFLGLFAAYFQKISGQEELAIGVPVLNRSNAKFKQTIGLFASVLPLRISAHHGTALSQLLPQIKTKLRNCYKHQKFPVDRMGQILRKQQPDVQDLFEISLSFEKHDYSTAFLDFPTESVALPHNHEKLPLAIYVREYREDSDVKIDFDFNTGVWDNWQIELFLERFDQVLSTPPAADAPISFWSERDKYLVQNKSLSGQKDFEKSIVSLFEEQVKLRGSEIALHHLDDEISFDLVKKKSDQVAGFLQNRNLKPGSIVAYSAPRSEALIYTVLGIYKAGCVYLPLDPTLPVDRKKFILEHSGCSLMIGPEAGKNAMGLACHSLEEIFSGNFPPMHSVVNGANDPAYIIYTSGSTGIPKGVVVPHGALMNTLVGLETHWPLEEGDRFMFKTNFGFDVSLSEIFSWILGKGSLCISPMGVESDPMALLEEIQGKQISHINFVPSMFRSLADYLSLNNEKLPSCLKFVFLAGEELPVDLARQFFALSHGTRLLNLYGPTEAAIYATGFEVTLEDAMGRLVPIGKAFPGTTCEVLDGNGFQVPPGVLGELFLSGKGLASGYLNAPELSSEKFCTSHSGRIHYRTGDRVRINSAGDIEYLGRLDGQAKLRGYRIEKGEIEFQLKQVEGVIQAVVEVIGQGADQLLVAFVQRAIELHSKTLSEHLKACLPSYMIPSHWNFCDGFPLNSNGKIDRKKLLEKISPSKSKKTEVGEESKLKTIWNEVLPLANGSSNHFFEAGGHSLKALQLMHRVKKEMGVELSLKEIFSHPTLPALEEIISQREQREFTTKRTYNSEFYPLSEQQKKLFLQWKIQPNSTVYNLFGSFKIHAEVNIEALKESYQLLVEKHHVLRSKVVEKNGEAWFVRKDEFPTLDVQKGHKDVYEWLKQEGSSAFHLKNDFLFKAGVIASGDQWVLWVKLHHIITDGWSLEVLLGDWADLYLQVKAGKKPRLNALQYSDFVHWQKDYLESNQCQEDQKFWEKELTGMDRFTLIESKTASAAGQAASTIFRVEKELTDQLKAFAQKEHLSFFALLMSAYQLTLAQISESSTIVVGSPFSGRLEADWENIPGYFVNTLPVASQIHLETGFLEFAKGIARKLIDIAQAQMFPLEHLKLDHSPPSWYDCGLTWQNTEETGWKEFNRVFGAQRMDLDHLGQAAKFHFWMIGWEKDGSLEFEVEYDTNALNQDECQMIVDTYIKVLQTVTNTPEIKVGDVLKKEASSMEQVEEQESLDFNFNF